MGTKDIVTGRNKLLQTFINFVPKSVRLRTNPSQYAIDSFVRRSASKIKKGSKVLDAGAGPCPYKKYFQHCDYESTDFIDNYGILDFVCSVDKIPRKNNSYDAILLTEVLEHVEYPQKVMDELYRILKRGGKLYFSVPQGWKVHQEPYNFYYFTNYGLKSLLENTGFKKFKISPKGGYFWLLGDMIRFNSLLEQCKKYWMVYYPLKIIEYPINNIILPVILFHLDFLDRERKWTLGYTVEAEK